MSDNTELRNLTDRERDQALARFRVIQAHLEDGVPLSELAKTTSVTLRTLQRWLKSYRDKGLVGLTRSVRSDQGTRRISDELIKLIEGFALQKPTPSIAYIYRKVYDICVQQQWSTPSYSQVYSIVQSLDPALVTLAHEGEKRYKAVYDLVYRREAMGPNGIWQADHTLLDIWVLDEKENPVRPWLTIVLDDYSRAVAGYFVSVKSPSAHQTALALHQAIWRKSHVTWHICGIPDVFYTDHGSDFTSKHMEQVAADLKMRLVFSLPGMPRGRGKIERFFETQLSQSNRSSNPRNGKGLMRLRCRC